MNLPQALEIVKDHIRIGKGMELTNGVPEALEMVAEELSVTQKALELACEYLHDAIEGDCDACPLSDKYLDCHSVTIGDCYARIVEHFLAQAKEGAINAD